MTGMDPNSKRQLSRLVRRVHDQQRQIEALARATPTRHTAIDSGPGLVVPGADGTPAFQIGPDANGVVAPQYSGGPKPATPSAPMVESGAGVAIVSTDGMDVNGAPAPADHYRTVIYASLTPDFEPGPGNEVDSMLDPVGSKSIMLPPGLWHIRIVWVTLSHQVSDPSDDVSVDVDLVVDTTELEAAVDSAQGALDELKNVDLPAMNGRLDTATEDLDTLANVTLPNLNTEITNAKTRLTANEGEITASKSRLSAAETTLTGLNNTTIPGLNTTINALQGNMDTLSNTTIPALNSRLGTAETDISTAAAAAATAQSAANAAATEAGTAAGIAAGKADVLIQSTVPAVDMRKATTLWIDTTTSNNTPKRWSGSAWVALTDKVAVDAAAAAAAAQSAVTTATNRLNTLENTTIPALQSTVNTAQTDLNTLQNTTLPGLSSALNSATGRLNTIEPVVAGKLDSTTGTSGNRLHRDVYALYGSFASSTDSMVIRTNILVTATIMARIKIEGAELAKDGTADIDISFYAYNYQGGTIHSPKASSNGTRQVAVRLATDAQDRIVIILDPLVSTTWAYPRYTVTEYQQGYNSASGSETDWSHTFTSDLSVYTRMVTPSTRNVDDAVDLTGEWRTTGGGRTLRGDKLEANSVKALQIDALDIAAAVATVIQLNASRITSGMIDTGRLNTSTLAAALATILELNANRITSGQLSASRIDVTNLAVSLASIISLDAGRITSGTIDTARLSATEIAAAVASVISLNANRITSGTIDTARLNVTTLAASLATVLSLDAGRITTGQLGADRIDVADLAVDLATVITLNANRITSGTIDTERLNTTTLAAALATILELDAGRITTGQLGAARINTTELAASIATIIQLNASRITAGTLDVDRLGANSILTSKLNTAEIWANTAWLNQIEASTARFRSLIGTLETIVSGTGLLVSRVEDAGGDPVPLVQVGGGGANNFTTYDETTGETLGSLGADGSASFTELAVQGDPQLAGTSLLGSFATDTAHGADSNLAYMDRLPRGIVGWHSGSPNDVGPYVAGVEYGFLQVNARIEAGRRYRVYVNAPHIGYGGTQSITHQLRSSVGGSNPTLSSALMVQWGQNLTSGDWSRQDQEFYFNGASYTSSINTLRVLFSIRSGGAWSFVSGGTYRQIAISIEDVGPEVAPTGQLRFIHNGGGTPPPDPEPNVLTTYNSGWNADWFRSFMSGGGSIQTQGNGAIMLKQGYDRYWSGGGLQTSLLGITNGADAGDNVGQLLTTALSGATMLGGYLSVAGAYIPGGGTKRLRVYWHGNTSAPSSYNPSSQYLGEVAIGATGRRKFYLPQAALDGLKNGSIRGFGFSSGGSTSASFALGVSWSTRPFINLTYRK